MQQFDVNYQFGFYDKIKPFFSTKKGLSEKVVREISHMKSEPQWMLEKRLAALQLFYAKKLPMWGGDLTKINFDNIYYYLKPTDKQGKTWDEVPEEIKNTFDKIGIPEAERKFLAGVGAQYDSEVVYHSISKMLEKKGVIFVDSDTALQKYPELVKKYFGTIIPAGDNKFAALNTAVWSGGSFIYIPPGVHVDLPLQAYFRINAKNMGQFERTLIIADEGSYVHYVEGCFLKGAKVRTNNGEKNIEDIKIGDTVLTHKGKFREVYNVMRRVYKGKIFHIRYYGDSGRLLQVTKEHPLLVCKRKKKEYRNSEFKPQWLPAEKVEVGDYLAYPILQKETEKEIIETETIKSISLDVKKPFVYNYKPHISLSIPFGNGKHVNQRTLKLSLDPDFYRLMGYFLSEGHVDYEHYLTFTFNYKEQVFIEDVKNLILRYFSKEISVGKKRNNGQVLTLSSTVAARFFAREFGETNHNKRIPSWVLESPHEHIKELINGMWRGDGNYSKKINIFRYNTVTIQLAHGFRDALLKLGIVASINSQKRGFPKQIMHCVVVSRPCNKIFGQIVGIATINGRKEGSPFYMDKNYIYLPIKSIRIEKKEDAVYNFSVVEDESYIAEGVVSHNCTAPIYTTDSLHSAVVEILVKKGARVRYTTIQNWSKNVYNLVTKRMFVEEEGFGEWIDGNLGCLQSGSTVTTTNGLKNIEDVQIGDNILSYDERTKQLCFKPVTAKRFSGMRKVRRISSRGRTLYATSNHPFYSFSYEPSMPKKLTRYKLSYVRADEIKYVILPQISIPYGRKHIFVRTEIQTTFTTNNQYAQNIVVMRMRKTRCLLPNESDRDILWLFGLFIGDGSIDKKMGSNQDVLRWSKLQFSVPVSDRAYEKLIKIMNRIAPFIKPSVRKDKVLTNWCSNELVTFFEKNGMITGCLNKSMPEWIFSLPEDERLAFVAGLIDSDGTITVSKRRFVIKTINEKLVYQIGKLLTTLGIFYSIFYEKAGKVKIMNVIANKNTTFIITFSVDPRLIPFLSDTTVKKINKIFPPQNEYFRLVGRSNISLPLSLQVAEVSVSDESATLVPTWDIEVAETENFVSEGFIVHNSQLTMKYPSVYLKGRKARGEVLSLAFAGEGQHQDAGGKAIHLAPETSSVITSKSISKNGGRTSYRGLLKVVKGAENSKSTVRCDALILDPESRSDTYPTMDIDEEKVTIGHEASVSKIGEEQLFYFQSRGISQQQAEVMIVNGFVEPIVRELPMEYAVELNRLIQLEMTGAVG